MINIIKREFELLNNIKEFSRKSEMTEEEAIELGRKVNSSLSIKRKSVEY